jgi:hypothetical protein
LVFLGQAVAEYEGVHRKGCDPAIACVDGTLVTEEKVLTNEVGAPLRARPKLEFSLR